MISCAVGFSYLSWTNWLTWQRPESIWERIPYRNMQIETSKLTAKSCIYQRCCPFRLSIFLSFYFPLVINSTKIQACSQFLHVFMQTRGMLPRKQLNMGITSYHGDTSGVFPHEIQMMKWMPPLPPRVGLHNRYTVNSFIFAWLIFRSQRPQNIFTFTVPNVALHTIQSVQNKHKKACLYFREFINLLLPILAWNLLK